MQTNSKKRLIIAICISAFSSFGFAEENCADPSVLSKLSNELSNGCSAKKSEQEILEILPNEDELQQVCSNCKVLIPDSNGNLISLSKKELDTETKASFAKAALNEIRKNVSNHLKKLMTLRSTTIDFNPSEALKKCDLSSLNKQTCDGKNGPTIQGILKSTLGDNDSIAKIQAEIGNEIYNIAYEKKETPALFERQNPNSCRITDNQFLQGRMKVWEKSLDFDIVSKIKEKIDSKELVLDESKPISAQINSKIIGRSNIGKFESALNHPLVNEIFRTKKNFETFFRMLKLKGSKQQNNDEISDLIYHQDFSNSFATQISNSCKQAFDQIKNTLCSEDFQKGNLSLSHPETIDVATEPRPFNSSNKEKNLALYCHGHEKRSEKPLTLKSLVEVTSSDLDNDLKFKHFNIISKNDFEDKIYSPKERLCEDLETSPCAKDEVTCSTIALINNSKISGSPEEALLKKHNPNIDKILSAFVGTKPPVTKDAEKYLIAQGIIPAPNGEIAQPSKDQKPQSPSSFAAAQKQFATQNPKYSYTAPAKNGVTQPQQQPGQNSAPSFNPQRSTGSKIGQNDMPDENEYPIANDRLMQTKNGIMNRLGKQIGPRTSIAKDVSDFTETPSRKPLKTSSGKRGMYSPGSATSSPDPVNNPTFIPEGEKSKLTEGPKKKDEFNEAKQMMGNNRQPANDSGVATGGQTSGSASSPNSPTLSVAANGDNVITLDTSAKDLEVTELVKQLKEKLNAEQLQVILESDKKIKVLVNGKEIILTPTPTGYHADSKEASLKKYLEALSAFFSEQLKDVARVDDLNKVFK